MVRKDLARQAVSQVCEESQLKSELLSRVLVVAQQVAQYTQENNRAQMFLGNAKVQPNRNILFEESVPLRNKSVSPQEFVPDQETEERLADANAREGYYFNHLTITESATQTELVWVGHIADTGSQTLVTALSADSALDFDSEERRRAAYLREWQRQQKLEAQRRVVQNSKTQQVDAHLLDSAQLRDSSQ